MQSILVTISPLLPGQQMEKQLKKKKCQTEKFLLSQGSSHYMYRHHKVVSLQISSPISFSGKFFEREQWRVHFRAHWWTLGSSKEDNCKSQIQSGLPLEVQMKSLLEIQRDDLQKRSLLQGAERGWWRGVHFPSTAFHENQVRCCEHGAWCCHLSHQHDREGWHQGF